MFEQIRENGILCDRVLDLSSMGRLSKAKRDR